MDSGISNFFRIMQTVFSTLCKCAFISALSLLAVNCGANFAQNGGNPRDVMGIYVGMERDAATRRLAEIAKLKETDRKQGQLWTIRINDPRLSDIGIGYDRENKVKFVTAFVDKDTARERIRYSDLGDLSAAKTETVGNNKRYIWEVAARDGRPAYFVDAHGDEPDFVSFYVLAKKAASGETQEDEEEDN